MAAVAWLFHLWMPAHHLDGTLSRERTVKAGLPVLR